MIEEFEYDEVIVHVKEDAWFRNENAHIILRKRVKTNRPYCVHCKNRLCADPEFVIGTKALKKCKRYSEWKHKFYFLGEL